jgi:hypothetical protein
VSTRRDLHVHLYAKRHVDLTADNVPLFTRGGCRQSTDRASGCRRSGQIRGRVVVVEATVVVVVLGLVVVVEATVVVVVLGLVVVVEATVVVVVLGLVVVVEATVVVVVLGLVVVVGRGNVALLPRITVGDASGSVEVKKELPSMCTGHDSVLCTCKVTFLKEFPVMFV